MTDYGHPLQFGTFVTPSSQAPDEVVGLTRLAEQSGLDLATFQDHPYQPAFLDTWTLLSYAAGQTRHIHLAGNVLNLPLRTPAVLARSAASLDILSGGRFELGLGAGAFWDAIEAMGGRRLSPGEAVDALSEAIDIIRGVWDVENRSRLRVAGRFHAVDGAKRGPAPLHQIGIWLGAYKPRMLRLVGRKADGWLPSLGSLAPGQLAESNKVIDEAARAAGRHPDDVRRLLNVNGRIGAGSRGFLDGPPEQWVAQLTELALGEGIATFILGSDDGREIEVFGKEVAPAVRELVGTERAGPADRAATEERAAAPRLAPGSAPTGATTAETGAQGSVAAQLTDEYDRLGVRPTPYEGTRLSSQRIWDESSRPRRASSGPGITYTERGRQVGRHLIDVHDMLRRELEQLRDLISQVRDGHREATSARAAINELTLRQNDWVLGAYCANYCTVVAGHHSLEDSAVFPHLRTQDEALGPVIDRLADEHRAIHRVLTDVDRALVRLIEDPEDFAPVQDAVDLLTDTLLSHLSYEEDQLVEPLARLGFYPDQI
ncbi:MAG: LLM class flavin-dependent oxidoreductase [Nocardioidaceae bacterium]